MMQQLGQNLPFVLLLGVLIFVFSVGPRLHLDSRQKARLRLLSFALMGISLVLSLTSLTLRFVK